MQTAPLEEVQKEVEGFLSRADGLQLSAGQLASALVSRSLANPTFYPSDILVQLVRTQFLCHRYTPQKNPLGVSSSDTFSVSHTRSSLFLKNIII